MNDTSIKARGDSELEALWETGLSSQEQRAVFSALQEIKTHPALFSAGERPGAHGFFSLRVFAAAGALALLAFFFQPLLTLPPQSGNGAQGVASLLPDADAYDDFEPFDDELLVLEELLI